MPCWSGIPSTSPASSISCAPLGTKCVTGIWPASRRWRTPTSSPTAATPSLPAGAPRRRRNPSWPESEEPSHARCRPVNWQPISQMPLIASMIDGALDDTRDHVGTLNKARDRPHVLDDATIDRVERVHSEQLEYIDIYDQQISRWRTEKPSADRTRKLDQMEEQNQQLRAVTMEVLAL